MGAAAFENLPRNKGMVIHSDTLGSGKLSPRFTPKDDLSFVSNNSNTSRYRKSISKYGYSMGDDPVSF